MTLDSQFSFPIYLSMDLMLVSPDLTPQLTTSILESRTKLERASQTDLTNSAHSVSQTDITGVPPLALGASGLSKASSQSEPSLSHIANVTGLEAKINLQSGGRSTLKNKSLKVQTSLDHPNSGKLSKNDLELIQERGNFLSEEEEVADDTG